MTRYSAWRVLHQGLRGQTGWTPAWRAACHKPRYDAVIFGGGGRVLAAACYLAQNDGLKRVAVLERGWQHRPQHHGAPVEPSQPGECRAL